MDFVPVCYILAPYVKVYLMNGKKSVEKQKTVTARRTLDPLYQQQLCFTESYSGKILQVNINFDYNYFQNMSEKVTESKNNNLAFITFLYLVLIGFLYLIESTHPC
jgi:C2 domain